MKNRTAPNQFLSTGARRDWFRVGYAIAGMALVIILAIGLALAACTPAQRSTMSGAFAACADSDLGTLVAPGITVASDVAGLIKSNSPTLEADLTSLVVTAGIDAVECAIVAAEAVLLAPTPGAGSGLTVAAPPPGVSRARAWLGKARAAKAGTP